MTGCAAHEYTAAPEGPIAAAPPAAPVAANAVPAPGQMERDRAQCEYQADLATANMETGMERGWRKGGLIVDCMKLKGWNP